MFKNALGKIRRFMAEEDGPTAIEYMVMISIIVIACLVAINTIGSITSDSFDTSAQSISDALGD